MSEIMTLDEIKNENITWCGYYKDHYYIEINDWDYSIQEFDKKTRNYTGRMFTGVGLVLVLDEGDDFEVITDYKNL